MTTIKLLVTVTVGVTDLTLSDSEIASSVEDVQVTLDPEIRGITVESVGWETPDENDVDWTGDDVDWTADE